MKSCPNKESREEVDLRVLGALMSQNPLVLSYCLPPLFFLTFWALDVCRFT